MLINDFFYNMQYCFLTFLDLTQYTIIFDEMYKNNSYIMD